MWRDSLTLMKPGIIMGNLIAAIAGYLLAAKGHIHHDLLAVVLGSTAVVASGCLFNNYIDRDIDQKMRRTRHRIDAITHVGPQNVNIIGFLMGVLGFSVLAVYTNWYAVAFAALGFVVYVFLYSLKFKRHSTYGTLIGSLSGACPPIIGYTAVTNSFDMGALILLLTFCFWQIPHSYAIAIYRFDDYKAANIPVLPIEEGVSKARKHMIWYIVAFALASLMLSLFGYVGSIYTLTMGLVSIYWLYLAKVSYSPDSQVQWARRVFVFSIVAIMAFSALISIDFVASPASHVFFTI
ncbi:heme o synthase [Brackiella oedipodis]|uniref:heme o synthase n=1 Tax=Brackiella oedipodis TaxID=124225 RepID=UPI00048A47CC|nr:heme o synthase [Brackiella oedipodis]